MEYPVGYRRLYYFAVNLPHMLPTQNGYGLQIGPITDVSPMDPGLDESRIKGIIMIIHSCHTITFGIRASCSRGFCVGLKTVPVFQQLTAQFGGVHRKRGLSDKESQEMNNSHKALKPYKCK